MKSYQFWTACFFKALLFLFSPLNAVENSLPEEMQKIMHQTKYDHAIWGLYVKDLQTGQVLFDLNSEKLFSPASTTKLFSVAALLHAFGDDYRFKTPVFASGKMIDGKLQGDLILVAQGDLTMGGRQPNANITDYTKLDHIIANEVPGAILTKENPLQGLNELARQVYQNGIRKIDGNVLIDDSLFETTEKRGMVISPIIINENLIDIVVNPTAVGQKAHVKWRPDVPGYTIENQVNTIAKEGELAIEVTSDESGQHIIIKGNIPLGQHDIVRTSSIKDPKSFARIAFIQALRNQGIEVNLNDQKSDLNSSLNSYKDLPRVGLWVSPPLSEYAKLILKVSHNLGADLVPLLLASQQGKKTFNEGMRLLGDFVSHQVKLPPSTYVFIDAAGGNENRLTPRAEIQLLEYMYRQSSPQFQRYFNALPILGVDGSSEDFAKHTQAAGKVYAKTGTGASFNLANETFFLITQALSGYIEGKNDHLFAFMMVVNNGSMPSIEDVFSIFEDQGQLANVIYNYTNQD